MSTDTTNTVYTFIQTYTHDHHGQAPTIREIAAGTYLGRSTVMRHLDRLEAWGLIEREPYQARSIQLTDRPWPPSAT